MAKKDTSMSVAKIKSRKRDVSRKLYQFPTLKVAQEKESKDLDLIHFEIGEIRESQGSLFSTVDTLKTNINSVKEDIGDIRTDIKEKVDPLAKNVATISNDLQWIKRLIFISITASTGTFLAFLGNLAFKYFTK